MAQKTPKYSLHKASGGCVILTTHGKLIQPNIALVFFCVVALQAIGLQESVFSFLSRDCFVGRGSKVGYEKQYKMDTKETVHNAFVLK
jgi:hypothetical protein